MFYIALVIFIIIGEWKLKNYIEATYDFKRKLPILKNKICLHKYHNHGAFLNIMEKKKKILHFISFIFTFIIMIFFFLTLFQKGNKILKTGLALLLGGAFSNTYDRLSRDYVIDYFSFCSPFKKLNRIVFNISDFCIIIGAFLSAIAAK